MITESGERYRSKTFIDVLFFKMGTQSKYIYYICNQAVRAPDGLERNIHQNKDWNEESPKLIPAICST